MFTIFYLFIYCNCIWVVDHSQHCSNADMSACCAGTSRKGIAILKDTNPIRLEKFLKMMKIFYRRNCTDLQWHFAPKAEPSHVPQQNRETELWYDLWLWPVVFALLKGQMCGFATCWDSVYCTIIKLFNFS